MSQLTLQNWHKEWNPKRLKPRDLAWLKYDGDLIPVIIEHLFDDEKRYSVWLPNNKVVTCGRKDLIGIEL